MNQVDDRQFLSETIHPACAEINAELERGEASIEVEEVGGERPAPSGRCIHNEVVLVNGRRDKRRRVWLFSGRLLKRALRSASAFALADRYGRATQAISDSEFRDALAGRYCYFHLEIRAMSADAGSLSQWIFFCESGGENVMFNAPSPDELRRELVVEAVRNKLVKSARRPRRKPDDGSGQSPRGNATRL